MSARIALPSGLVTFLFTDIEGSTRLAQMLGAGYRPVLSEHRRLLRRTLSASDGAELFTEGDSFFVAFADAGAALDACVAAQRALADHEWPTPRPRPRVRMGLHTGHAEPHGGEYASARGAPRRPGRRRGPRWPGALLGRDRPARRAGCPTEARAARSRPAPAARLRRPRAALPAGRPGPGAGVPAPAHRRRRPAQPAHPGHLVRRPAHRARRAARAWSPRTGWSPSSAPAVPARPGWPSSWPLSCRTRTRTGSGIVDLAAVTDPGLVPFAIAAVLGLRPEPGRPILETLVEYAADRRMLLMLDTCDAQRRRDRRGGGPAARRRPRARACWPPAASRSACRARWSGASRRCRWCRRPAADRATRSRCCSNAPPRPRRPAGRSPESGRPAPGRQPGWTGCRWRSSWPPRGCGCSPRASSPSGWTTSSARWTPGAPNRLPRRRGRVRSTATCGTPPCRRRSRGRTGRSARARRGCCAGSRCSPARSTCRPSSGCSATTRSTRSPCSSTSR